MWPAFPYAEVFCSVPTNKGCVMIRTNVRPCEGELLEKLKAMETHAVLSGRTFDGCWKRDLLGKQKACRKNSRSEHG